MMLSRIRLAALIFACLAILSVSALLVQAVPKSIPVLVIGIEFPGTDPNGANGLAGRTDFPGNIIQTVTDQFETRRVFNQTVTDRIFGANRSVSDYFEEVSYGQFRLENAGVFGPYQAEADADHYWNAREKNCEHGWSNGHAEKKSEAVHKFIDEEITKRKAFDLSIYDKNKDGTVTQDELILVVVFPQHGSAGFVRSVGVSDGSDDPFKVGNVSWRLKESGGAMLEMYTRDFSRDVDLGLLAHELSHMVINAGDMYENSDTLPNTNPPGWDPTEPGPYSLMDNHGYHSHLDPLHKIKAGWVSPIVISKDGYYNLRAVADHPDIYKLADPNSHQGEYFLVENRQRTGYDDLLPDVDGGLAIWHIQEDRLSNWRTAVEMEPAIGDTNPIQWQQYLWAAYTTTGGARDWWHASQFSDSRWHDSNKSFIGVWRIPASSNNMRVYLDVPGPGILLQVSSEFMVYAGGIPSRNLTGLLVNTGASKDVFELRVTGIDPAWMDPFTSTFTLDSYEQATFSIYVRPPKCTPEQSINLQVTVQSTTDPGVSITETTKLNIQIPEAAPNPDAYETNDTIETATPITLPSTGSMNRESLTLHTDKDVDFFSLQFTSDKSAECLGSSSKKWGSFISAFQPQYTPGGLTVALSEEYCRQMQLSIYHDDGTFYKQFQVSPSVIIDCPSQVFPTGKLAFAVSQAQGKKLFYDMGIALSNWHITLRHPLYEQGLLNLPPTPEQGDPALRVFDPRTQYTDLNTFSQDLKNSLPTVSELIGPAELGDLQHGVGQIALLSDNTDDAEAYCLMSLATFRELGDTAQEANVLRSLGEVYSIKGGSAAAVEYLQNAETLHRTLGDEIGLARDQMVLGEHYARTGDAARALQEFSNSRALQASHSDTMGEFLNLLGQTDILLAIGEHEAATAALMLSEGLSPMVADVGAQMEAVWQRELLEARLGERQLQQIQATVAGSENQALSHSVALLLADAPQTASVSSYPVQLNTGINVISLPLNPGVNWRMSDLASHIGSALTFIAWYDGATQRFISYFPDFPEDSAANKTLAGGEGYILVTARPVSLTFTGTAWNSGSTDLAAPTLSAAHVLAVDGQLLDGMSHLPRNGYHVLVRNERTQAQLSSVTGEYGNVGRFTVTFGSLGSVVAEAGDTLSLSVTDTQGVHLATSTHILSQMEVERGVIHLPAMSLDPVPRQTQLLQNYPNPFNPETWIPYQLADDAIVSVSIYNAQGELIRQLPVGLRHAGNYADRSSAIHWDGRNNAGERVASGVYSYSIQAGSFTATRKMLIVK